jgi:hypothetical protein
MRLNRRDMGNKDEIKVENWMMMMQIENLQREHKVLLESFHSLKNDRQGRNSAFIILSHS